MIDISAWGYKELQEFVKENLSEDSHLDFKDSRAISDWTREQRGEMAKDVSSFANAGGGIIIYGAVESKPNGDQPTPQFEKFDTGITGTLKREAIEDTLTSELFIHKKIDGLVIRQIKVPGANSNFYLVISIPMSFRAPHMHNPTKRYYKRHNFKAEPMEGYEVEDIRNRTISPQVKLTFPYKRTRMVGQGEVHYYSATFVLENVGTRTLKDYYFELRIPEIVDPDCGGKLPQALQERIDNQTYRVFHSLTLEKMLFPGQQLHLCTLNYKVDDHSYSMLNQYNPKFYWRLYKDDASPDIGEEFLNKMHNF